MLSGFPGGNFITDTMRRMQAVFDSTLVKVGALPTIVTSANSTLKDAFDKWGNCTKLFGGSKKVDAAVDQMTFFDGRGSGWLNLAGGTNSESFAQFHSENPSVAAAVLANSAGGASNLLVLFSDYFAENQLNQDTILVHDFFRSYFDFDAQDHSDIIKKFKIQVQPGQSNSDAIDDWIKNDCENKK